MATRHTETRVMRRRAILRWTARRNVIFAWVVLIVAAVHPPHGTGLQLCWSSATTGVRCPGCGLTRSVSCAVRGMWSESWRYHVFGSSLLALCGIFVVAGALPRAGRRAILRGLIRRRRLLNVMAIALLSSFIVYGALRTFCEW